MESKNLNPIVENKAFWETHVEQFKQSNLSKAEYARRHQLVKHRFIYWAHKFELADTATQVVGADFIPVKIKSDALMRDKGMPILCTLQLGNGKQLLIHQEAALKLCLEAWR